MLLLKWRNIPEQTVALRMALSLSPPDETFWKPVGIATAQLPPKEKVDDATTLLLYALMIDI